MPGCVSWFYDLKAAWCWASSIASLYLSAPP